MQAGVQPCPYSLPENSQVDDVPLYRQGFGSGNMSESSHLCIDMNLISLDIRMHVPGPTRSQVEMLIVQMSAVHGMGTL